MNALLYVGLILWAGWGQAADTDPAQFGGARDAMPRGGEQVAATEPAQAEEALPPVPAAEIVQVTPNELADLLRRGRGAFRGYEGEQSLFLANWQRDDYPYRAAAVVDSPSVFHQGEEEKHISDIVWQAEGNIFGWRMRSMSERHQLGGGRGGVVGAGYDDRSQVPDVQDRAQIILLVVEEEGQPAFSRWLIAAADGETAERLARALREAYVKEMGELLSTRRQVMSYGEKPRAARESQLADARQRIQAAEAECAKLGLTPFPAETLLEVMTALENQRRLNDVDLAGIEAQVKAVAQRMDQQAKERVKPGEEGDAHARSTALYEMRVRLEIELIGHLAKKDALQKSLDDLRRGQNALQTISESEAQVKSLEEQTASSQRNLEYNSARLATAEAFFAFDQVDPKIRVATLRTEERGTAGQPTNQN